VGDVFMPLGGKKRCRVEYNTELEHIHITSNRMSKYLRVKMVLIIVIVACTIIGVANSAYTLLIRPVSQLNFNNNALSVIQPSSAKPSKINITIRNNINLVHNQSNTEDWLTYHHDFFRTGLDPYKHGSPSLSSIKKNWTSDRLDGDIYAEPLVARSMVFVATENNTIYSLDADTGKVIWRTNLGSPVPLSDLPCGDIDPTGVTGTPVIDTRTQTIFAVAFLSDTHRHELFALDIGTGKIRFETDVDPPGSDPIVEQQRGALALSYYDDSNNSTGDASTGQEGGIIVYVPFGGLFGDCGQYHGWMVGAPISYLSLGSSTTNKNNNISNSSASSIGIGTRDSEETKQQLSLLSFQVPTNREGGIWAPSGPAIDHNGNVLVATGNGQPSTDFDFGNSVIKLSPELEKVIDWFAPSNWAELDISDTDLGSVGPTVLDNNVSDDSKNHNNYTASSVIFQIGKEGIGYLLSGDKLGGINGEIFSAPVCDRGAYGGTAYAAPYLYVPCREGLVALELQSAAGSNNTTNGGSGLPGNTTSGSIANESETSNSDGHDDSDHGGANAYSSFIVRWTGPRFHAGPPIVADGVVLAIDINKGELYAFDQSTGKILFQEDLGDVVHFSTPSSSHGQIFVAASNKIMSFSIK
jgi:outer membrane protein assembly factor BamB